MFQGFLFYFAILFVLPAAHATEGKSEAHLLGLPDQIYVNYFATFNGPGLTDLGNTNTLNNDGVTKNHLSAYGHVNFDSTLTAAYLISPKIGIGPVIPFIFYPTQGYGATLGDVGISAFDKKLIADENLKVFANIILQIPSSDISKNNGMDLGVKTTPNFRYHIPKSRFAFGTWGEAKAYLGVKEGTVKSPMKSFKLYGLPYLNYQASPQLSWNLGFEMEASHFNNTNPLNFTLVKTDLQPGFVFMITPRIMVNPFVQIFTSEKVALDRTALSAVLSATL
jgi:hypothetical protein